MVRVLDLPNSTRGVHQFMLIPSLDITLDVLHMRVFLALYHSRACSNTLGLLLGFVVVPALPPRVLSHSDGVFLTIGPHKRQRNCTGNLLIDWVIWSPISAKSRHELHFCRRRRPRTRHSAILTLLKKSSLLPLAKLLNWGLWSPICNRRV